MKNDCISLAGLAFYSYHGFYNEERKLGNNFIVDIKIYADLSEAYKTDNIKKTIDYIEVYKIIEIEFNNPSHLLEHIGYKIMRSIFNSFNNIHEIEITVTKKSPPIGGICDGVSIKIQKTATEFHSLPV